jgi:hypothetical protein
LVRTTGIPLVRAEHTPLIVPGGIKWRWTLYGLAIRGECVPVGFADFEDAQAKFRVAWDVADKR